MEIICARIEEKRIAKEFGDGHVMVYAVQAYRSSFHEQSCKDSIDEYGRFANTKQASLISTRDTW